MRNVNLCLLGSFAVKLFPNP